MASNLGDDIVKVVQKLAKNPHEMQYRTRKQGSKSEK